GGGVEGPGGVPGGGGEGLGVGVDDSRASPGLVAAGRDVRAIGEPRRSLADVRWPLDEPLARAVRVDDVHLRVVNRGVEPRERDLAVRPAWGRRRRNRRHGRKRDGEQHDKTDPSVKGELHSASLSPLGEWPCRAGLPTQSRAVLTGELATNQTSGQALAR